MGFSGLTAVCAAMSQNGVQRLYCKALAQNDNRKQQIYLGSDWKTLNFFPFGEVSADDARERPNFKAAVDFSWLADDGTACRAPRAQLILYPDYPEIRLSGFLARCQAAPREHLQPVPKDARRKKGEPDGRLLLLGVTHDRQIIAYLATARSRVARDIKNEVVAGRTKSHGLLVELEALASPEHIKAELLGKLKKIRDDGPLDAQRLDGSGKPISISAKHPHAGGYTLEAALGLTPNGTPEPDYKGWEVKAFSSGKITVIEPEPDAGYYGIHGCRAFLQRYGLPSPDGKTRFTGTHKIDVAYARHQTILVMQGFDVATGKIVDIHGGLHLWDTRRKVAAATWSFSSLVHHWGRKHHQAVYVPYKRVKDKFQFVSNSRVRDPGTGRMKMIGAVWVCEGTDFSLFLAGLARHSVYYDPGSSMPTAGSAIAAALKGRNPFRVSRAKIPQLYHAATQTPVD